jgi:hypothetical protein
VKAFALFSRHRFAIGQNITSKDVARTKTIRGTDRRMTLSQ